ncbi:MAG: hypothetical protein JWP91_4739 [Fibrobacteres bacterium]|nr:hypothetical protein [Fibrobacterota bacterium]
MKKAMPLLATILWAACAPSLPSSRPGKAESSAAGIGSASAVTVDAVLPTGRNLFLFDFSRSRFRKWTLSRGPMDSLGLCRVLDTLQGDWGDAGNWRALAAPSRPFAPMRAFWGPSGNFFLLDRAGKRLGLYDSSAQFLSSFPLPSEIRERNLDRIEVFWTRDGLFSFLDLGEGKVWQYAEQRSPGGQGDWRLRNTVRLPVGLESCLWEPFFRDPCCIQGEAGGANSGTRTEYGAKGVCFDKYFNPIGPWPEGSAVPGLRPAVSGSGSGWILRLDGGPACGQSPPACFSPDKGNLSTCPTETDAAPAR